MIRRVIWLVLVIALMIASFATGRLSGAFRTLPAIVTTLPGDESNFGPELEARLRARFPAGSKEDDLIAYLADQKFAPEWRRRDAANTGAFVWSGLLCQKIVRVSWRADAAGALSGVSGAYQSHCLQQSRPYFDNVRTTP